MCFKHLIKPNTQIYEMFVDRCAFEISLTTVYNKIVYSLYGVFLVEHAQCSILQKTYINALQTHIEIQKCA